MADWQGFVFLEKAVSSIIVIFAFLYKAIIFQFCKKYSDG